MRRNAYVYFSNLETIQMESHSSLDGRNGKVILLPAPCPKIA